MRRTVLVTPRGERLQMMVPETAGEREHGANGGVPAPYAGLVFNFDPPFRAVMTMRETPMALQIAFVGADQVVHFVHEARPHSGIYTSPQRSRWVIETLAPVLRVGDRVQFALT